MTCQSKLVCLQRVGQQAEVNGVINTLRCTGMGYECDEHTRTCPSAHTKYFAASGGICVTNVITAVQLQDDRIKLLLKRGGGGVGEWMTRKTLVTKWSGGDDMKVGGWQGKTQTVRGHYRGGKQRGWM